MRDVIIDKSIVASKSNEACFELWTTEEGIKKFFAPNCSVDLRVGGPFEMYFLAEAKEGERGSEGCKFLSYIPNEMVSFSWNAPPQFPTIRNGKHYTWVVITFSAKSSNETKVRLQHLGWLEGEEWDAVFNYFDLAWARVLESFKKVCSD